MSNLFIVNFFMVYIAIAGFVYGCVRYVNQRDNTQRSEFGMFTNAMGWLWYMVRNYTNRIRTVKQMAMVKRATVDNTVIKQFAIRHGRLVNITGKLSNAQRGDVIYQFHHPVWKRDFHVIEGRVLDGDTVTWMSGHIDPLWIDEDVLGWSKLMPAVRNWLQHKA